MKHEKLKQNALNILTILFSLGIVFIFLEIVFRFFGPEYYKFNNYSAEYYSNSRGYYYPVCKDNGDIIYGLDYRTTSDGYRKCRKEQSVCRSGRCIKIVGIGDSFTYGQGVKCKDLYLNRLRRLINRKEPKYKVINFGVDGANIWQIRDIYEKEYHKFPPGHIVVYGFVLNDFGLNSSGIKGLNFIDINNGGNQYNLWRKKSAFLNFLCYSIEKIRLHTLTTQAYLDSFETAEEEFNILNDLNKKVSENNGELMIMIFPLLYNFQKYQFKDIHNKIKTFCRKNDILVLDLLPAFSKFRAEDLWAHYTDHHPNEIAHRIAAEELADFLKENIFRRF